MALNVNFKFMILKFTSAQISPYTPDSRILLLLNMTAGVSNNSSNVTHPKSNSWSPLLPHSLAVPSFLKLRPKAWESPLTLFLICCQILLALLYKHTQSPTPSGSVLQPCGPITFHLDDAQPLMFSLSLPCAPAPPCHQHIFNTAASSPVNPKSYHVSPLPRTLHWLSHPRT